MNPRLVGCLYASIVAGALAGVLALVAGWGWLIAFALYSATGSATLVGITLTVRPGASPKPLPAPADSRTLPTPVEPRALPARALA